MTNRRKIYCILIALLHFNLFAIAQGSQRATDYYNKAIAAQLAFDYKTAIDNYTEAIKIEPAVATYFLRRGESYYAINKYDLVIEDLSKAITLGLDPYYLYEYRGKAFFKIGKYDLALVDLNTSIDKNKYSPDAYITRSELYRKLKKYDLALEDCERAIRNSGSGSEGYRQRGLVYDGMRQYDLAIAAVTQSISINKTNPYAFNDRAYYYTRKGNPDSAIIDFTKAIELKPDLSYPYSGRGRSYFAMGEYEKAIIDFKKAISLEKDYVNAHLNMIFPLSRLYRFTEAADYYNKFRSINSMDSLDYPGWNYVRYYIRAAGVWVPQNNFEQALNEIKLAEQNWLQQTESKNATEASYYSSAIALKGYVLEKVNRNAEARDAYKQSLAINPNQPDIKEALAAIEKKLSLIVKEDKTGPMIELISPQPTRSFVIESDIGSTQITGRAKDESGIASVKINGNNIEKVEEDGLFITNFTLKPGANSIIITATDKQGNTATKTFIINGTAVVKKKELDIPVLGDAVPKYYAILIAGNDYLDRTIKSLENPIRDARDLKILLEKEYTFDPANIDTLYNRSREEIMQAIIRRCNTLTENDNLIIFYAGHGIAEKDKFGGLDAYWIPVSAKKGESATYISASDINISLKRSNAKHILLIADACFSGAYTRSRGIDMLPGAGISIEKQYKVSSRKVMASGNMELVPDDSKFFYYLKKTLKDNREKYVSAKDVFNSFYDAILRNTENLPQYSAIMNVGDEGGEFIFIKK